MAFFAGSDDFDDLDALVNAELDAEAAATAGGAEPEPEPEEGGGEWPHTAEEMDEQLETCFLQVARTRLHKVRKTLCSEPFVHSKRSFYQDRLNIGKS
eukprot:COSAG06_NODE_1815_length_8303_cov_3.031936_15_plen_98_part_00